MEQSILMLFYHSSNIHSDLNIFLIKSYKHLLIAYKDIIFIFITYHEEVNIYFNHLFFIILISIHIDMKVFSEYIHR